MFDLAETMTTNYGFVALVAAAIPAAYLVFKVLAALVSFVRWPYIELHHSRDHDRHA